MGKEIPACPYCDNTDGNCQHVVVHYDRSFGMLLSGYLKNENHGFENLKQALLSIIKKVDTSKIQTEVFPIDDIWTYALDTYDKEANEIDLDIDAYISFLEEIESDYNCISFRYPSDDGYDEDEDDETPNNSSANIIFYSENPQNSIQKYNSNIIAELIS